MVVVSIQSDFTSSVLLLIPMCVGVSCFVLVL